MAFGIIFLASLDNSVSTFVTVIASFTTEFVVGFTVKTG